MSQTLYVRLHREANVPGDACAWILRSRTGEELGRGSAPIPRLPRAGMIVAVIGQDMTLIRTVRLPPGRRARTPEALAGAIEPFLLSDPGANHVIALGDDAAGGTAVAAITRTWIDSCLTTLRSADRAPARVVLEAGLAAATSSRWIAVCRSDGGFLCLGERRVETLDASAPGDIPAVLRMQLKSAAGKPECIAVHADASRQFDPATWSRDLGIPVEARGAWDWAGATAALSRSAVDTADLLGHIGNQAQSAGSARRWRLPIILAAAAIVLHVGATTGLWIQRNTERNALNDRITKAFQRAVGPQAPLVDASVQTTRALEQARRKAGEYAAGDFMSLFARIATLAGSTALPPNALRSVQYTGGRLVLEWENVPAATLERFASELNAQGAPTEITTQGMRSTMSVRSES